MSGINKVILIGHLGNDPEMRYMPSGSAVATLSVATSKNWKDKQTGEKKEQVEWHRVVFFNKLAEICREYLKKGAKIYVEGELQTKKWTDKQGMERYTTQIVGNSLQMLDSKGYGASEQPAPSEAPYSPAQSAGQAHTVYHDDDIPF